MVNHLCHSSLCGLPLIFYVRLAMSAFILSIEVFFIFLADALSYHRLSRRLALPLSEVNTGLGIESLAPHYKHRQPLTCCCSFLPFFSCMLGGLTSLDCFWRLAFLSPLLSLLSSFLFPGRTWDFVMRKRQSKFPGLFSVRGTKKEKVRLAFFLSEHKQAQCSSTTNQRRERARFAGHCGLGRRSTLNRNESRVGSCQRTDGIIHPSLILLPS